MAHLHFLLHTLLAVILAPLLLGVTNRVKAKFSGRHGKPLLQLYFDIAKLLKKSEVLSTTTSWVFTLGPSLSLAATFFALLLLPMGGKASPLCFQGDWILVAYLLGLGRFFVILAALDTGSPFEGMGASREATFSAFAEPVLFLCMLALASLSCSAGLPEYLSLSMMLTMTRSSNTPVLFIIPLVLFMLTLVENCRIPIDDPTTHLELTMIHEAMILDHSGPDLAYIHYGVALKIWFFAALLACLLVPDIGEIAQPAAQLGVIFGIALLIGIIESVMARLRMIHISRYLGTAGVLAAIVLIFTQILAR